MGLFALLLLFLGCHTTRPVYDEVYLDRNNVTTFVSPEWKTSVTPAGWGMVGVGTIAGAYAGSRGDGIGGVNTPAILDGTIGGVIGGGAIFLANILLAPDPPSYRAADSTAWLQALDERLTLVDASFLAGRHRLGALHDSLQLHAPPRNGAELQAHYRAFGPSSEGEALVREAVATFPHRDLPLIDELYPRTEAATLARQRFVREARSFEDLTLAASVYPELADSVAWYGLRQANSRLGISEYLRRFPDSPYQSEIVSIGLRNLGTQDLRDLANLLTDSTARLPIGHRLLKTATSVTDVRAVVERFPSLRNLAERHAYELAETTNDFRHYLSLFPEGPAAEEIEERLWESMKTPENLGRNVNSRASEYGAVITPDGSTLYFTRSGTRQNRGGARDEDIWVSVAGPLQSWTPAVNLRELNNRQSNAVISVTPDGNTLLLHGEYSYGEWTTAASLTHRTERGWSQPEALRIDDFYNRSQYMQSFLANDGQTLLMAIERDEGVGQHDIYISFLKEDGSWTRPKNLGGQINTTGADDSPFLASDGKTLYFSSNGHGGEGGHDIFMSRRLDDSWTRWSKPVNLGPPVNTKGEDIFFFIPASGDLAYFASERSGFGYNDIFRVLLPKEVRPTPVVLISGVVRDQSTGKPLGALIRYERLSDGSVAGRARSDPATGAYKITLPAGENYGFRAEAEGYIAIGDNIDLSDLKEYREIERDLELVPLRSGALVRLNNIFFDVGRSRLRPTSFPELRRLVDLMKSRPTMNVEVLGHTDSVGTNQSNQLLSQNRAQAVADYLTQKGITEARLKVIGYGEERPTATNETAAGRGLNRRVEIRILE